MNCAAERHAAKRELSSLSPVADAAVHGSVGGSAAFTVEK